MLDGHIISTDDGYDAFLDTKRKRFVASGFDVQADKLNPHLFDFQRWIVQTALKKGRYAVFAECGLGKTLIELEWSHQVVQHTGGMVLNLAPLAVSGQTIAEGERFGIPVSKYDGQTEAGIYITNYEQIENIDPSLFAGIVLDESSILKNFEGKTKEQIITGFAQTLYKLAGTATPSPNDVMELGNHAEFLNVMSRNEMLAMYFVHDGGETAKWRLKGHATPTIERKRGARGRGFWRQKLRKMKNVLTNKNGPPFLAGLWPEMLSPGLFGCGCRDCSAFRLRRFWLPTGRVVSNVMPLPRCYITSIKNNFSTAI